MPESILIPGRFNGPLDSGNGGYSCGAVAALLDGPAEVSLKSPVPLDTPLETEREADGVRVLDGETLVAEGRPAPELELELPEPVGLDAARDASRRYRGLRGAVFSRCFVCGLDREDSFGVFAGRVADRELVASPWTPPGWTSDERVQVKPEVVWAVLDCPTFFAAYLERDPLPVGFLVRQRSRLIGAVPTGVEHVVMSWRIETEGSKSLAGSAVVSAEGEPLAVAEVLLVEPGASR